MMALLSYNGSDPVDPAHAVRDEVWDIQKSGSEGDFDTSTEDLQSILTKDLKAALDRRDPIWRGWTIDYEGDR